MSSVDFSKVKIVEKPLYVPPLQEVADVITAGLRKVFQNASASVTESPDLTQAPYSLTAPGLSGNVKLLEVGGVPYLMPLVQPDKLYDLVALARHMARAPAHIIGAGAGPWPLINVNCEGVIDLLVKKDGVVQGSHIVSVEPVGAAKGTSDYKAIKLPENETRIALLGNCLISDGKPGKLIKVVAKKRIGETNFITTIREALKEHYGDKVVGLGGTFLLVNGKVKHHVMPQFSSVPLTCDEEVDEWLHFFEMKAPITHVGTLVTGDLGLDLRVQHFHGWGPHGDGGHYHYDTTPEEVEYEAYFSVAEAVVRVDAPTVTHAVGRD